MAKDKGKVGFVAIYRKIQDHWLWQDKDRLYAWLDILISAQFHDAEKFIHGTLIKIPRGSWFVAQKTLETRWGWSKTKVRHFLNTLEMEGMITTKSTPLGTTITIVNYEVYQNPNTTKNTTKSTTEDTTEDTTEVQTEDTHTNHIDHVNQGNHRKPKTKDPLSAYTFSQEEIDRLDELGDEKAFPNQEIADLYWRKVLQIERGQIERPH